MSLYLLLSLSLAQASELTSFIGNYQGKLTETGKGRALPVEVSLSLSADNKLEGFLLSLHTGCTASLSLEKVDGEALILSQSKMPKQCNSVRLVLKKVSADTITVKDLSAENKVLSSGTLKKTPQSDVMKSISGVYRHRREQRQRLEQHARQQRERDKKLQQAAAAKTQNELRQIPGYENAVVTPGHNRNQPSSRRSSKKSSDSQTVSTSSSATKQSKARSKNKHQIKNINGYWMVSGVDGTLSKLNVTSQSGKKHAYDAIISETGIFNKQAGYAKGDIFQTGGFYPRSQGLVMAQNFRYPGVRGDIVSSSSCRVMIGSHVLLSLVDISHLASVSEVKAFKLRRNTPASKICKYPEFGRWSCDMARCTEYYTEKELAEAERSKSDIVTNDLDFARQYQTGIVYKGKSYDQKFAEMESDTKQKEIKAGLTLYDLITGRPNEVTRKYREQESKRRTDAIIQQSNRHYKFKKKVEQVKQTQLQKPDAQTCNRYKVKEEYDSFEEAALYGVKPGMLLRDMHDALMCNGFSPDANKVTAAGGLQKYLSTPNKIIYMKARADGTKLRTEIGTVPLSYQERRSKTRQYRIKTFSVSHRPTNGPNDSEWNKIVESFMEQYDVGGRKSKNRYGITFVDRRNAMSVGLSAQYNMQRGIYGYYITLCCGK